MNEVTSGDGTTIAFDRLGEGSPVILVCGGSTDRTSNAPLAAVLAEHLYGTSSRALAHSLAYDATIMGDYSLPTERAAVGAPTIVIAGGRTYRSCARRRRQDHNGSPEAIAPVMVEFFAG